MIRLLAVMETTYSVDVSKYPISVITRKHQAIYRYCIHGDIYPDIRFNALPPYNPLVRSITIHAASGRGYNCWIWLCAAKVFLNAQKVFIDDTAYETRVNYWMSVYPDSFEILY